MIFINMKKKLLTEIERINTLMGLSPKKLLMEDGVIGTLTKKILSFLDDFAQETITVNGNTTPTGSWKNPSGKVLSDVEYNNIKSTLNQNPDDLAFFFQNLEPTEQRKVLDFLLSDTNIVDETYNDTILDFLKSQSGRDFQLPNGSIIQIKSEEDLVKLLSDNPNWKNDLYAIFGDNIFLIEILERKFSKKISEFKLNRQVDNPLSYSNSIYDVSRWANVSLDWSDEMTKMLNRELNPTIKDLFKKVFSFFNNEDEFTKLQKYLRQYARTQDSKQKEQLERIIKNKFKVFFMNRRKLFETTEKWISDVISKYPNSSTILKKELENFQKQVKEKNWEEMVKLGKIDNTISKIIDTIATIGKLSKDSIFSKDNINIFRKIFQKANKNTPEEIKSIANEAADAVKEKTLLGFNWNWVKTGSKKGWPSETNKLWLDYTNGNLSQAKRLYALELFGRYLKLHFTWGLLEWFRNWVSWIYIGLGSNSDAESKILTCKKEYNALLQDPEFKKKLDDGTVTMEDLPESCSSRSMVYAIEWYNNIDKHGQDLFFDKMMPDLFKFWKLGDIMTWDEFTDIMPGKGDDFVDNLFSFINWTDQPANLRELNKIKNEIVNDIKTEESRITQDGVDNTDEKYSNDINGFKLYLKDEKMPEENPKLQDNVFLNGTDKYKFVDSNTDNKGKFEYIQQDY